MSNDITRYIYFFTLHHIGVSSAILTHDEVEKNSLNSTISRLYGEVLYAPSNNKNNIKPFQSLNLHNVIRRS